MTDEPDILGPPYTVETIDLPDDAEGPVHATLVRRPAGEPTSRAVLHVHGFADYFFQTGYAQWWNAQGYDFYAIDLRKYGFRSASTTPPTTSATCGTTTPRSTRRGPGCPGATDTTTWC